VAARVPHADRVEVVLGDQAVGEGGELRVHGESSGIPVSLDRFGLATCLQMSMQ
jgi:hypothetical protein